MTTTRKVVGMLTMLWKVAPGLLQAIWVAARRKRHKKSLGYHPMMRAFEKCCY